MSSPDSPGERRARYVLYGAAFSVGAATMGAELGAARLVAPYFGTSTVVWALVIGATLLSLSVGQLFGGWLTSRGVRHRGALTLLLLSAGLLALLPFVGRPLMAETLQRFYSEDYGAIVASALSVTTLTGVPLLAMGALGPIFLQLIIRDPDRAGQLGSFLYAWGTIGSLLGTYVSGLILIPLWGTTKTLLFFAAILAMTACLFLPTRKAAGLAITGVAVLLIAWAPPIPIKNEPGQLVEAETAHNYVAVLQQGQERHLVFNDGFAVQSVYRDDHLPLHGVWGHYAAAPAYGTAPPESVLMLGLGGGTAALQYRTLYPEARVLGVEIDRRVVELGHEYMGLPRDVDVVIEDARTFLAIDDGHYDVILVDAFQFPYIPFQLTTREFFELLHDRLSPGGVVLLNVGRDGHRHDVVHALARTSSEIFTHVVGTDVRGTYNSVLFLTDHPPEQALGLRPLNLPADDHRRLLNLDPVSPWQIPPDTPLMTDDHAPIEWLTDLIVLRHVLGHLRGDAP